MSDNKIQRGDLLEIIRHGYTHHGVAVNENEVVHVQKTSDGTFAIVKENINAVAGGSTVRSYVPSDSKYSKEETAHRAESYIGQPSSYGVLHNNCEHFATHMATGKGYSKQVEIAKLSAAVAVAGCDDWFTNDDVKKLVDDVHTKK